MTIALFAMLVLLGGCRSRSVHIPRSGDGSEFDIVETRNLSSERRHLIEISREWMGTPYKYAASEKGRGTDCSGMVLEVYLECLSLELPRNSAKQAEYCKKISRKDVKPGDLVFFATGSDPDVVSHVGIMLDDDNFIHASASKGVCISRLSNPYYTRTLRRFGRVPGLK